MLVRHKPTLSQFTPAMYLFKMLSRLLAHFPSSFASGNTRTSFRAAYCFSVVSILIWKEKQHESVFPFKVFQPTHIVCITRLGKKFWGKKPLNFFCFCVCLSLRCIDNHKRVILRIWRDLWKRIRPFHTNTTKHRSSPERSFKENPPALPHLRRIDDHKGELETMKRYEIWSDPLYVQTQFYDQHFTCPFTTILAINYESFL